MAIDAAAKENVVNLADAEDVNVNFRQAVEEHAIGRRHGVIVPVAGAQCE